MSHKCALILTYEKHFTEILSQLKLDYCLFSKLMRITVALNVSSSLFKLNRCIQFLLKK